MTDKELKKLKKIQLMELLVKMSEKNDELKARVKELEEALSHRDIVIEESGSIAEAALRLNHIFEDAQKAADDYLAAVKKKGKI